MAAHPVKPGSHYDAGATIVSQTSGTLASVQPIASISQCPTNQTVKNLTSRIEFD